MALMICGRKTFSNVQALMWCVEELVLPALDGSEDRVVYFGQNAGLLALTFTIRFDTEQLLESGRPQTIVAPCDPRA